MLHDSIAGCDIECGDDIKTARKCPDNKIRITNPDSHWSLHQTLHTLLHELAVVRGNIKPQSP